MIIDIPTQGGVGGSEEYDDIDNAILLGGDRGGDRQLCGHNFCTHPHPCPHHCRGLIPNKNRRCHPICGGGGGIFGMYVLPQIPTASIVDDDTDVASYPLALAVGKRYMSWGLSVQGSVWLHRVFLGALIIIFVRVLCVGRRSDYEGQW